MRGARARARSRSRRSGCRRAAADRCRSSSARARRDHAPARLLRHAARRERGVVAADRDQVVDAERAERLHDRREVLGLLRRVRARRLEDRAALEVDARDGRLVELAACGRCSPCMSQRNPSRRPTTSRAAPARHDRRRADHAVDAGRRAAADEDPEARHATSRGPGAAPASGCRTARPEAVGASAARGCARRPSGSIAFITSSASARSCPCTCGAARVVEDRARVRGSRSSAPRRAGSARGTRSKRCQPRSLDRRDEPLVEIAARLVDPRAAVDEREQDARRGRRRAASARGARATFAGLLERRPVRHRQDGEIGGVEGVPGQRLEVALRVEDDDARERRAARASARSVSGSAARAFSSLDVGRRRHELHAVLAELDRALEAPLGERVLQVRRRPAPAAGGGTCGR